jgi:hypothetical protein
MIALLSPIRTIREKVPRRKLRSTELALSEYDLAPVGSNDNPKKKPSPQKGPGSPISPSYDSGARYRNFGAGEV